jgi:hypothetical protein
MDDLVVVFRAAGLSEAGIIKGFLESAEIPVHLNYESAGAVYGLTVDGLGEVRVQVPAEYDPLALELLEEQLRGTPEHDGILRLRARRPGGDDPGAA